jgi:hypothetical protein
LLSVITVGSAVQIKHRRLSSVYLNYLSQIPGHAASWCQKNPQHFTLVSEVGFSEGRNTPSTFHNMLSLLSFTVMSNEVLCKLREPMSHVRKSSLPLPLWSHGKLPPHCHSAMFLSHLDALY